MSVPGVLVHACLRDGEGGSPTAVVEDDGSLSDEDRSRVPAAWGASHAVFIRTHGRDGRVGDGTAADVRFFTSEGELPACGHGTVAALSVLAARAGAQGMFRTGLRASGRVFDGWADVRGGSATVAGFDPGPVALRAPTAEERALVLPALGVADDAQVRVAGVGRERLLVSVPTRTELAELTPRYDQLRAVCDHFGLLGAYVYCAPSSEGRLAARMFAPSIGVPEDIANANSTACLAAHLSARGTNRITVDMGDALGRPATIIASAGPGPAGPRIDVGGTARLTFRRAASSYR